MSKISVIIKEPHRVPRHVNISNTLDNLQNTVGGYIEVVRVTEDIVAIVDEEGRLKQKEWCSRPYPGLDFYGTVIFCGTSEAEFSDLPCAFSVFKIVFGKMWEGCE